MPVEKNDVTINKLLHWGEKFTIKDKNNKELQKVFIRLVGDADLNRARVFALRKSAEFRRKFKNQNSDEYIAYMPDFDEVSTEVLIEMVINFSNSDLLKSAYKASSLPYPVEPDSDATLEEQEKYQKDIDEYPTKFSEKIRENLNSLVEVLRTKLSKMSREDVIREYKNSVTTTLCEQEMLAKFKDYCVYLGSYKDKNFQIPAFTSFEEFENLLSEVKDQFVNYYDSLEIGTEELKK